MQFVGSGCILWVLSITCEVFGRHTAYLVNPAQVGWSVIYELLGPFVIRKPLDIEFYDCGGKDGWGRVDRWKSVFQGCGSFRLQIFCVCMFPVRISQELRIYRTFYWLVVGRVGRSIWLVGMYLINPRDKMVLA